MYQMRLPRKVKVVSPTSKISPGNNSTALYRLVTSAHWSVCRELLKRSALEYSTANTLNPVWQVVLQRGAGFYPNGHQFYLVISPSHYGVTWEACACLSGHCSVCYQVSQHVCLLHRTKFDFYETAISTFAWSYPNRTPDKQIWQGLPCVSKFFKRFCSSFCLPIFPSRSSIVLWRAKELMLILLPKVHRTKILAQLTQLLTEVCARLPDRDIDGSSSSWSPPGTGQKRRKRRSVSPSSDESLEHQNEPMHKSRREDDCISVHASDDDVAQLLAEPPVCATTVTDKQTTMGEDESLKEL